MKSNNGGRLLSGLITLGFLLGLGWAAIGASAKDKEKEKEKDIYQKLDLFARVLTLIQNNYVEDVDVDKLIYGAIRGMVASLDPHSSFLEPSQCQSLHRDTSGEYGGVGLEITMVAGQITVLAAQEDTPAARAGLKPYDLIVAIDGESMEDSDLTEAQRRLIGPPGSSVTVTISRTGGPKALEITMIREQIRLNSVAFSMPEPGIGYVRIKNFQDRTIRYSQNALRKLHEQAGGALKGLVIDLRGDPGGLLEQAVQVADLFLEEGVIVSTRGRDPGTVERAHRKGTEPFYPTVVLVDGGTASAAEILAGALQDHNRAVIVGTPTFGKGSVQTIIEMEDGSCAKITIARYYTPSGRSIQELGIQPDILVDKNWGPPPAQGQTRERDLKRHFRHESQEPPPAAEEEVKDPQLQTAVNIIKRWDFFGKAAEKKAGKTPAGE